MTCIVGLITKDAAYIGGDTRLTQDSGIINGVFEKVFFKNNLLFGFCGNYRLGQILRYRFSSPDSSKQNFEEYLNTKFIDALMKCLEKAGHACLGEGDIPRIEGDGSFFIASNREIFTIDPDFCVTKVDEIEALGSGAAYAIGSLETTKDWDVVHPTSRIQIALEVACKYAAACAPPFVIMDTNGVRI